MIILKTPFCKILTQNVLIIPLNYFFFKLPLGTNWLIMEESRQDISWVPRNHRSSACHVDTRTLFLKTPKWNIPVFPTRTPKTKEKKEEVKRWRIPKYRHLQPHPTSTKDQLFTLRLQFYTRISFLHFRRHSILYRFSLQAHQRTLFEKSHRFPDFFFKSSLQICWPSDIF